MTDTTAPRPHRPDGTEPIHAHGTIFLRPAERDDLPQFVAWFSDARTTRTLAFVSPISQTMEERWFERLQEENGQGRWHFVICRLADDRAVGVIDLHEIDRINGSAGLGIVIGAPDDTGRGYGSDALRAILAFGFGDLRLERVWLDVYDFNERARHVYERVGFVHEGTLRRALYRDGAFHDVQRMAILRSEWDAASA
jgi:RimJ/RimL family protein N-acetyltransferase